MTDQHVRTFDDARRWTEEGTRLVLRAVSRMGEETYNDDSALPGWTRKHLIAHVAANADALGNLVRWARTRERTPMYASPGERTVGIERGPRMSGRDLGRWLRSSCAELAAAMGRLTDEQWAHEVVTARGRTVPATEIPWLRAREVYVHAVDLDTGTTFADLPDDFLEALCADAETGRGAIPPVEAPLAERAAWLTGRPHGIADTPDLGPWL